MIDRDNPDVTEWARYRADQLAHCRRVSHALGVSPEFRAWVRANCPADGDGIHLPMFLPVSGATRAIVAELDRLGF